MIALLPQRHAGKEKLAVGPISVPCVLCQQSHQRGGWELPFRLLPVEAFVGLASKYLLKFNSIGFYRLSIWLCL